MILGTKFQPAGVTDTSRAAFHDNVDNFETMEDRIVNYLGVHPQIHTRHELAAALRIATSTMSGRINALLRNGRVIEEPGRYTCKVTGRRVRGVSAAA